MATLHIHLPDDGGELTLDLSEEILTVGRLPDNSLHLDHASVSSRHAEIVFENDSWLLRDLESTNGTFVNEEQVSEALLKDGDHIRFGGVDTFFRSGEDDGEEPPPELTTVAAEAAGLSARPADFFNSSPIPRHYGTKDPAAKALVAGAIVAFLAAAVAAVFALQMAAPLL